MSHISSHDTSDAAAALTYGLDGGTLEVLATTASGEVHIGGEEFDNRVY